jgi:MFS family permease
MPKLGELKTVRVFYTAFVPVFASVPFIPQYFPGIFGTIALGFTNGLSMPSMNSLVSRRAPREMQGSIMGLTQSLGSLARIIGPLFANWLFQHNPSYPYLYGAALATIPAVLAWVVLKPSDPSTDNEPSAGMVH